MDTDFQIKTKVLLKLFKAGKCSEADILNMKTEEMLNLPNVLIKEIKVICAIKENVKSTHSIHISEVNKMKGDDYGYKV